MIKSSADGDADDVAKNNGIQINEGESTAPLVLPPEVWAMVMNHLDYQDVISCAATSKLVLHDAMPLVTHLHINKLSELDIRWISRYRTVTSRRLTFSPF